MATKKQKQIASDGGVEPEEKKKPIKKRAPVKKPTKKRVLKRAPSTLEDTSLGDVSVVEPVVSAPSVDEIPAGEASAPVVAAEPSFSELEDPVAQQALNDVSNAFEPTSFIEPAATATPEPPVTTETASTPSDAASISAAEPVTFNEFETSSGPVSTEPVVPEFNTSEPVSAPEPASFTDPAPTSFSENDAFSQPQSASSDFGAGWQDFSASTPAPEPSSPSTFESANPPASSDSSASNSSSDDVVIPDFSSGKKEEDKNDSNSSPSSFDPVSSFDSTPAPDAAPVSTQEPVSAADPVSFSDAFTESVVPSSENEESKVLSEDRFMDLNGGALPEGDLNDKSEFLGEIKSSIIGTFKFKKMFGCFAAALILIGIGFYLFYGKTNFIFSTWDKVVSIVKKTGTTVTQVAQNVQSSKQEVQPKVENKNAKPQGVSSQESFIKDAINLAYKIGESYEFSNGGVLTPFLETSYIVGVLPVKNVGINTGLVASFQTGFIKSVFNDNAFKKYVSVFGELKNVYDTDIYNILNNSTNRSEALDRELVLLEDVYKRGTEQDDLMLKEMAQIKSDAKIVDGEKSNMEKVFFEDLKAAKPDSSFDKMTSYIVLTQKKDELSVRYNALKTLDDYYKIMLKRVGLRIDDVKKNKDALIQGVRVYEVPGSNVDVIIKNNGNGKSTSAPLDSSLSGENGVMPSSDSWNIPQIRLNF